MVVEDLEQLAVGRVHMTDGPKWSSRPAGEKDSGMTPGEAMMRVNSEPCLHEFGGDSVMRECDKCLELIFEAIYRGGQDHLRK